MRVREASVSLQLHGITDGVFGGKTRESLQSYTCLGAKAKANFPLAESLSYVLREIL